MKTIEDKADIVFSKTWVYIKNKKQMEYVYNLIINKWNQ